MKEYIRHLFDRLANRLLDSDAFDIQRVLQRRALEETATFVEREMPMVPPFANKFDLLDAALKECSFDGLYCEIGVYTGTTLNHIAARVPDRTIFGFDSFEGLPEDWRAQVKKGHFKVENLPKAPANARLIKGWFNETLLPFLKEHPSPVAFLHIDSDLYSSAKTVLGLMADRIRPGTVIVFDEYFNYPGWRDGEYKAFHEFVAAHDLRFDYMGYSSRGEQVMVAIRDVRASA